MNPGRFIHPIDLLQPSVTGADSVGQRHTSYETASLAWGAMVKKSGDITVANQLTMGEAMVQFTIFADEDIRTDWKAIYNGNQYNIDGVELNATDTRYMNITLKRKAAQW